MGTRAGGPVRGTGVLGRRGWLLGVSTLVAGLLHRASTEVAHAGSDGDVVLSADNIANGDTGIAGNGTVLVKTFSGTAPARAIFASLATGGGGRFGVFGKIGNPNFAIPDNVAQAGVWGVNANADGASGVKGETAGNGAGVRAFGNGAGIGLWADATTRVGIYGTSRDTVGIYGVSKAVDQNNNAGPNVPCGVAGQGFGRIGVLGISDTQIGVQGNSTGGIGVFGYSQQQIGVRGDSVANYGVYGTSSLTALRGEASGGGVGFVGIALNPGAGGLAGAFFGGVTVQGSFTVSGGAKSAAVPHPDGTHRRMYCQESPEPWFEDFGTATLTNGRAVVDLDPDFDAVVKGDDYLVFTMPEGNCNGLFISRKGPHRFVVEELNNGKSTVAFSYRVVSRRRESVGARLEKVDVKGPPTPKNPPQRVGPDGKLMDPEPRSPRVGATPG